jgi:hypothetical protein
MFLFCMDMVHKGMTQNNLVLFSVVLFHYSSTCQASTHSFLMAYLYEHYYKNVTAMFVHASGCNQADIS